MIYSALFWKLECERGEEDRRVTYDTGELRFYPASASRMGRGRELSTHALCFSPAFPLVKD